MRAAVYIIIILVLLTGAFTVYNYLVSIYEVIYKAEPKTLYADNKTEAVITAVPLNGLGGKAWFRKASASYVITEGENLVHIIKKDETEGILVLRAKDKPGTVRITARSPLALLPSLIEINIQPNFAEVIH